jgi:4-carboxymuconolactone decarboxylase
MKLLAATVLFFSLAASASGQTITITRSGSQPSQQGPAENFTGSVRVIPLFAANDPSRAAGASVSFEPAARSAWHTHPRGQVLIVTAGVGRVQQWGGPVEEIRAGDVVWTPPGVKHWHGASPSTAMTHIAIQEHLDGKVVNWLEKVSDEQYQGSPPAKPSPSSQSPDAMSGSNQMKGHTDMNNNQALSSKEQGIVTISALTATGDLETLRKALNGGLDSGLTVNEIKEVLVQMYAYCGFPRSLNGINTFMAVLEERKSKGIEDTQGKTAVPVADTGDKYERGRKTLERLTGQPQSKPAKGFGEFSPTIDRFLKEHLFADIFDSDLLNFRQRELATISALAAMPGVQPQLESHLSMGMNTGLTESELSQAFGLIEKDVSRQQAEAARKALTKVTAKGQG